MDFLFDSSFDDIPSDGVWLIIHRGRDIPYYLRPDYVGHYKFVDSIVGCFSSREAADAWCKDHSDFYFCYCGFFNS